MPFVMLKRTWPANFRRTITTGKKNKEVTETLEFSPGVPVDLSSAQVEALRPDIGVALVPVDFDEKARPRVITDEVVPEETEPANEPQPSN
jgi:hypothetical protein